MTDLLATDPFDARLAARAPAALRAFNAAGVLDAADVHVATRLSELAREQRPEVLLATALAVRGPRLGHVFVDLETIAATATVDLDEPVDLAALPWPDPGSWAGAVATSALTGDQRPLRLAGSRLYLDRYWREEQEVAGELGARAVPATGVDLDALSARLRELFPQAPGSRQALAAATAVLRRLSVIAGGPGTGKTTTVAHVIDLLEHQAAATGSRAPLIGLAAPTAVAAARLQSVTGRPASTIHRLLGWQGPGRFRHHRGNRLPHDAVILDETSMVSLSLMADLVGAVRHDARLVLVGDPGQLRSIEAGAVLGDIVGPAADRLVLSDAACATLAALTGTRIEADPPPPGAAIADAIVALDHVHRHGERIAALAGAIRRGDADAAIAVLESSPQEITWIASDGDVLAPIRAAAVTAGRAVLEAATAGDGAAALTALSSFRLLCAHRRGPYGVSHWTAQIEAWLGAALPDFTTDATFYVGRPLLVTENDYELRLFNGDTGVVVRNPDGGVSAVFKRGEDEVVAYSPSRLESVATVYAMTIHKAQGSQFDTAAVVLPAPDSRLLTRELLYTAATRAKTRLVVAGPPEAIRAGIDALLPRASGLAGALW